MDSSNFVWVTALMVGGTFAVILLFSWIAFLLEKISFLKCDVENLERILKEEAERRKRRSEEDEKARIEQRIWDLEQYAGIEAIKVQK